MAIITTQSNKTLIRPHNRLFRLARRVFSRRQKPQSNVPYVSMADIGGAEEARLALREIASALKDREQQSGQNWPIQGLPNQNFPDQSRPGRGFLITGPPGTGKTSLAQALAHETGARFYSISAKDLTSDHTGPRTKASPIHNLFKRARASARAHSPVIVFIDDLDALAETGNLQSRVTEELVRAIHAFNVSAHPNSLLIAAARQPEQLNPALTGSGGFELPIYVSMPGRQAREAILAIHTRPLQLAADVHLCMLARATSGFSGRDLAYLCSQAAAAAERGGQNLVRMADFEEALDRFLLGSAQNLILSDDERRQAAYHQAGHALTAWLTPAADLPRQVSIISDERAVSKASGLAGNHANKPELLLARLSVILGGQAAEELAMEDTGIEDTAARGTGSKQAVRDMSISPAAEDDLREAARLAQTILNRVGIDSSDPDHLAHSADCDQPTSLASAVTHVGIDKEALSLVACQYTSVIQQISAARFALDQLANALLEDDTLTSEALINLLGPRPVDLTL